MTKSQMHIHLLVQMLAIPSLSKQEDTRADFLMNWLIKQGLTVQRIKNNLLVTAGSDPAKAIIMLNSHIDTVPPGEGWLSDPFLPVLKEGKIFGLGSNDAGASVVSLIAAYQRLVISGLSEKVVLVISAEEEISGKNGISSLMKLLPNIKFAIIGEPTGMQPGVAERGLMVLDAVATGIQGHAARGEGVNSIYKAIEDIGMLRKIEFSEHSKWLKDPSINVTMIQAGTGHNVVPGKCEYVIDIRSNDRYSNERLLEIMRENCSHTELTPRSMRLKSSYLEDAHPVYGVLKKLGLTPFGSPTLSDMSLLQVNSLKIGPGDSARSHTSNEYIHTHEILDSIGIYEKLIGEILNIEL